MSAAPSELDRWLEGFEQEWKRLASDADLHRLALLRALSIELHAKQSQPSDIPPPERKLIEENLRTLRDDPERKIDRPLRQLLLARATGSPRTSITDIALSPVLLARLGRSELERTDRRWELALALQALRQGFEFWRVEAWVGLAKVAPFHSSLEKRIAPQGILLYVSAGNPPFSENQGERLWHGLWIAVFSPGTRPDLTYSSLDPATQWSRLYPEDEAP